MHNEIRDFIKQVRAKFPVYFKDTRVLEVGSLNINGSPREYFDSEHYIGIDIGSGNGVDYVTPVHLFKGVTRALPELSITEFDAVVSTEMLEHDRYWQSSVVSMFELVKPGGLLLITCAGPKRAEHGTKRTDEGSSPYTTDYYRNISAEELYELLPSDKFEVHEITYGRNGEDLLFYGIKKLKIDNDIPIYGRENFNTIPVTVGIPTKNRYETLKLTLTSILLQTQTPSELIIVDDSDVPRDLREDPDYVYIFQLMTEKGIDWKVEFGKRMGQHFSHQRIQDMALNHIIFRVDDDEVLEPNVLTTLFFYFMDEKVGAVAPAVLMPGAKELPKGLLNKVTPAMDMPNVQWFKFPGILECEHLYSCFMYRKGIAKFNLQLSAVAHREETLFTYDIFRAGYKLLANGNAIVYHFRAPAGGIRTYRDPSLWEHDEAIFQKILESYGTTEKKRKIIVLDSGLGDHYALKSVLPKIREQFPDITIAACFPEAFADCDVPMISIAEAKQLYGNIDRFQIYKWMWDNNWKGRLADAFLELYLKELK